MNSYQEDQIKYNKLATYFMLIVAGYCLGFLIESESKEKEISHIYKQMPLGCQEIMDIELQKEQYR